MTQRLKTLSAKTINEEIISGLEAISDLMAQYESAFNRIVQFKTEQRLGQTLFDSNYQSLMSNVFRSNDIGLLKPLFYLSHFQISYLSHHRESEYQALSICPIFRSVTSPIIGSLSTRPSVWYWGPWKIDCSKRD
jgi:hypothetical protein